jgi:hypothetical protein
MRQGEPAGVSADPRFALGAPTAHPLDRSPPVTRNGQNWKGHKICRAHPPNMDQTQNQVPRSSRSSLVDLLSSATV